jgi:hypothetical protein
MDLDRLLKMTAMKPRILKDPPTNDIGGDGDFALQVDAHGITLYVKYLKEWWFLTKAQKAAAKGTGRPIVQPEDTHHKTINAEKIKLKKRGMINTPNKGEIGYSDKGFYTGKDDDFIIKGSGSIKFEESGDGTADNKTVILKRNTDKLQVRDATDSNHADIECANVRDSNGKKVMEVNPASVNAVNHIKFSNSVTTAAPQIEPDGDDTNTSLYLRSKGTGNISASIPGTGNFNVLDDDDIRFRVTPDDVEIALLGQATHVAKIDCQNDAELRIWNFASASPTTGNDISISSDDEIYLAAGGNQIYLNGGGGNGSGTYDKGDTFGYFDFATASTCKLSSALNHHLNLISLGTGDVVIDSSGDIVLDSNDGNFIAKKAGTEFSVANGAYAGMVLGYRMIGESGSHASYTLTTSMAVTDAAHSVRFIAPPSGVVEVMVQIVVDGNSGKYVYFGLSDNSTYNSIGSSYETQHSLDDETDFGVRQHVWVVSGLTAGSTYTYWLGAKVNSGSTSYVKWGGSAANRNADFIMKVTALPPATAAFAEYD